MHHFSRRTTLLGLGMLVGGAGVAACARTAAPGGQGAGVRPKLYDCEGCEAVGERAPGGLSSRAQLAAASEPGERMILTGRVVSADGARPVADVVIYAHQTNAAGLYANGTPETEWSRRHGRLRGRVKTGTDGSYTFVTVKPAPYPDRTLPAHIHLFIGEPGHPPYYIDDVVFADEFGVTPGYRKAQELRGGSGITRLGRTGSGLLIARRNIRLERHA